MVEPLHPNVGMVFAAALVGTLGMVSLYLSWRRRLQYRRGAVILGWGLIAASVWFWTALGGAEFGPVLALSQLSLVAWAIVLTNRHVRPDKGRPQQPVTVNLPRFEALLRHAARFLVAVPVAGLSAAVVVLVLTMLVGSDADRMAIAILAFPLVWGIAAYWTLADTKLLRPAIGILVLGSAGAALIFA